MKAGWPGNSVTKAARAKAGGGFESAIENGSEIAGLTLTALDGTIAHGNRVRIEADSSYAIGPKAQAAPINWVMGSEIYVNGVSVTPESVGATPNTTDLWRVYTGANTIVDNELPRHPYADRFYRFKGEGTLKDSLALNLLTKEQTRRFCFIAHHRAGSSYVSQSVFPYTALTGTFNSPANRWRATGELCTCTSADGLYSIDAWVTHVDTSNAYATFEPAGANGFTGYGAGSSEFNGGTVTGQQSGATLTLGPRDSVPGSVKTFRTGQATRGVYHTQSNVNNGQFFNGSLVNGVQQNSPSSEDTLQGVPVKDVQNWMKISLFADYTGATSKVALLQENIYRYVENNFDVSGFDWSPDPYQIQLFGLDAPGTGGAPKESVGITGDVGEIYIDNDTRVLFLCDATTFATSTAVELLRPEAWTENPDGSVVIDAYLYQGAFADLSGKYLAMIDGSTVIFEGVAI